MGAITQTFKKDSGHYVAGLVASLVVAGMLGIDFYGTSYLASSSLMATGGGTAIYNLLKHDIDEAKAGGIVAGTGLLLGVSASSLALLL